MKEMNGSFRITAGAYNGGNLSPKYYIMVRKGEVKLGLKLAIQLKLEKKWAKYAG